MAREVWKIAGQNLLSSPLINTAGQRVTLVWYGLVKTMGAHVDFIQNLQRKQKEKQSASVDTPKGQTVFERSWSLGKRIRIFPFFSRLIVVSFATFVDYLAEKSPKLNWRLLTQTNILGIISLHRYGIKSYLKH